MAAAEHTPFLFLRAGDARCSQMAHALTRSLLADLLEPHSAGIDPCGITPLAIRAMTDTGVDIAAQSSTHIKHLAASALDSVATPRDSDNEASPALPGDARVIHIEFDNSPRCAREAESDVGAVPHDRRIRGELRLLIETPSTMLNQSKISSTSRTRTKPIFQRRSRHDNP